MIGTLVALRTVPLGVAVVGAHTAGGMTLAVDSCLDLDEDGGSLRLPSGDVVLHGALDVEGDTVPLLESLPVDLEDGDSCTVDPAQTEARATVHLDGVADPVEADVTHAARAMIPLGVLDEPLPVRVSLDGGRVVVTDVVDQSPVSRAVHDTGDGAGSAGQDVWAAKVTADEVVVAGMPLVGGQADDGADEPSWLRSKPDGAVVILPFTTASPYRPAGETVGYGTAGLTMRAGRVYRVDVRGMAQVETPGGYALVALRATTDGSTPGVSSPSLASTRTPDVTSAGLYRDFDMWELVTPAADIEWQGHVTMYGGESRVRIAEATILVTDLGPRATLADGEVTYSTGGWVPAGDPPSPPPATKRTYTTTWRSSHLAAYRGSGARRTDVSGLAYQGYAVPINGAQTGLAAFLDGATAGDERGKTLVTALSGATVTEVWVRARVKHTYNSAGGTIRFGWTTGRTFPSTFTGTAIREKKVTRDSFVWVQMPTYVASSINHLISISSPSKTHDHYLIADLFEVRVTYRR